MNNYLGKYENDAAIQTAVDNGELLNPYVAYNVNDDVIDWNGKTPSSGSGQTVDYFTIESIEDNNQFTFNSISGLYMSTDGENWVTASSVTLDSGDTVYLKRDNTNAINSKMLTDVTGNFNLKGNVMSLIYGDNYSGQTTIPAYRHFYHLFQGCDYLISAEDLSLPATILANNCYEEMFHQCHNLIAAPELPAMTMTTSCYQAMFFGCTSLTQAPDLPATTLGYRCYGWMFSNCTSLTQAPSILPATTLASGCYLSMFDVTLLTEAPILPAPTLVNNCYEGMFDSCSQLSAITCLATNISATSCLSHWVSGVSSTGVFYKDSSMSSWPSGSAGIPNNWNVVDYQG